LRLVRSFAAEGVVGLSALSPQFSVVRASIELMICGFAIGRAPSLSVKKVRAVLTAGEVKKA
jgi:hypothetical protein